MLAGALTLGTLVAFIQYSDRFFRPISDLSEKYTILQAAMASSERIFKLLDSEPSVASPDAPKALAVQKGSIEFRNVSFSYNPGEPVLHDISFKVEPGEKIAVVGATGAGKSTIIALLSRFYDVQQGEILIDGIDVRDYDLQGLRRSIGIVLQEVFLFSGSVAENIRLGKSGHHRSTCGESCGNGPCCSIHPQAGSAICRQSWRARFLNFGGAKTVAVLCASTGLRPQDTGAR